MRRAVATTQVYAHLAWPWGESASLDRPRTSPYLYRLEGGAAGRKAALCRLLEGRAFRARDARQEARGVEGLTQRAVARLPDASLLALAGLLIGEGSIAVEGGAAGTVAAARKTEAVAGQDAHYVARLHRTGRN